MKLTPALLLLAATLVAPFAVKADGLYKSRIERIFRLEMLGVRVVYLESLIGPAMRIEPTPEGKLRTYEVDGCRLGAYTDDAGETANGYSLKLTPRCGFNLRDVGLQGFPSKRGLTVGRFGANLGSVKVTSECIFCGAAFDPMVSFTFEGSHSDEFVFATITVRVASDAPLRAINTWTETMKAAKGIEYVQSVKFNCDTAFDEAAVAALRNLPVESITVGRLMRSPAFSVLAECGEGDSSGG